MTALGDLYEESEGKSFTYTVKVAGVSLTARRIEVAESFGVAGSASFEIDNPIPTFVVLEAPVEIYEGYNGILQPVFMGAVVSPSPTATGTTIECAGEGRKLTRTYKRTVITISGVDVNTVITNLLIAAGVVNYAVNLPAWSVGAVVSGVLEFTTYGDAINQLAMVDGDPWYELSASGQIRVEVKDPWPGSSAFRQYFSGRLSALSDAQRAQLDLGTLPPADLQPPGITNVLARPRVRYGVKQTTLLQNVRNLVVVEGAAVDVTDPVTGNTANGRLEAQSTASSPWVEPLPSGPGQRDITYDMPLIDTQAKMDTTAARYEYKANRLEEHVSLQVDGDPEIVIGMTVQVEDPDYTGITGMWFVYGFRHVAEIPGGFTTELDIRGGVLSGTTPLIAPVADFIFANPALSLAKIGQVLPAGEGNIVVYDGRSSFDPDGSIVNFEWSDDQGNFLTGLSNVVMFSYDLSVTSVVMTLTVTDNDGLTDAVTKTVPLNRLTDCGSQDTSLALLAAAIKTHASISVDGGKTWVDKSKAAAGVTGDVISARLQVFQDSSGSAHSALFGTSAGELIWTGDDLATVIKITLPKASPVVSVLGLNTDGIGAGPISSRIEFWWVAVASGAVYSVAVRPSATDYGVALLQDSAQIVSGLARSQVFFVYGGDTGTPASLLRDAYGAAGGTSNAGRGRTRGRRLAAPSSTQSMLRARVSRSSRPRSSLRTSAFCNARASPSCSMAASIRLCGGSIRRSIRPRPSGNRRPASAAASRASRSLTALRKMTTSRSSTN
jgi:hypothetical protein